MPIPSPSLPSFRITCFGVLLVVFDAAGGWRGGVERRDGEREMGMGIGIAMGRGTEIVLFASVVANEFTP